MAKGKQPWKVKRKEVKGISPLAYQSSVPEMTIHESWDEGNWFRFVLEGSGDILRELTKRHKDPGYIGEKITRTERFFIDPYRDIGYLKAAETPYLKKLIREYKKQPVQTEAQQAARELTIALAEGRFWDAKAIVEHVKKNLYKWTAQKTETKKGNPLRVSIEGYSRDNMTLYFSMSGVLYQAAPINYASVRDVADILASRRRHKHKEAYDAIVRYVGKPNIKRISPYKRKPKSSTTETQRTRRNPEKEAKYKTWKVVGGYARIIKLKGRLYWITNLVGNKLDWLRKWYDYPDMTIRDRDMQKSYLRTKHPARDLPQIRSMEEFDELTGERTAVLYKEHVQARKESRVEEHIKAYKKKAKNPLTPAEFHKRIESAQKHLAIGQKELLTDPHSAEEHAYQALGVLENLENMIVTDSLKREMVNILRNSAHIIINFADRTQGRAVTKPPIANPRKPGAEGYFFDFFGLKVAYNFLRYDTPIWTKPGWRHPHYRITVLHNRKKASFDYWGSYSDYKIKKKTLTEVELAEAFAMVLESVFSGRMTLEQFALEFGYPTTAAARVAWAASKKYTAKWKKLGYRNAQTLIEKIRDKYEL